jgi:hypothetical protein
MEKKKKQHNVYNLIILDESGSMEDIKKPTIRGFNEVVQTIKDVETKFPEQKHFISFVTFNGVGIKERLWNEEVSKLDLINEELYQPNQSTPLYDAIGKSISRLKEDLPTDITYNVLVTILTDGEENASHLYSGAEVKKMIDELKNKSWTFAYIGANHDVEKTAMSISITNTIKFEANEADIDKMFAKEKKARHRMAMQMSCMSMSENVAFNKNFYKEEEKEEEKKEEKK